MFLTSDASATDEMNCLLYGVINLSNNPLGLFVVLIERIKWTYLYTIISVDNVTYFHSLLHFQLFCLSEGPNFCIF